MTDHRPVPLGLAEVQRETGLSRAALDARRARGTLPPPDMTVGGRPAWWPETIQTWWEAQQARARFLS